MFRLSLVASFATALLSILPAPAAAQTREEGQVWLNLTAMGPIAGKAVYFAEVQPRSDGLSRVDALLLRGAVGVKLAPAVTLYQGYAHVVVPAAGRRDVNEERSFQQLSWVLAAGKRSELSSRTRLEQRWRSDGRDVGWRLREMIRWEMALRRSGAGPRALLYSELFVALKDSDWGARSGFDQMRNFVGLELPVVGRTTIEAGYLNQLIDQPGGRRRINHAAALSLWIRH